MPVKEVQGEGGEESKTNCGWLQIGGEDFFADAINDL